MGMRMTPPLVLLGILSAAAPAQARLAYRDLLEAMLDLEATRLPRGKVVQFSSYDRRSTVPSAPGWFANSDGFGREPQPGFLRTLREPDAGGNGEWLLADVEAPGVIVRGWSAGTIRKGEMLTTSGPYAFMRNPLYAGSFLIGAGLAVAGGSWLWLVLFLGFFVVVYRPTISAEAERLTEQFGQGYVDYAAEVPDFIPRLTPYRAGRTTAGSAFAWSPPSMAAN